MLSANLSPMEALAVKILPKGPEWRYEPKWDGFRCLVFKNKNKVELISKSGKSLNRYFPDIVAIFETLKPGFVLDGELVIQTKAGYSFSDLQLRLHPAASRVAKLASETPASFVAFDILKDDKGVILLDRPFDKRRKKLESFFKTYLKSHASIELSPQTSSFKLANGWLKSFKSRIDGIVAKRGEDVYAPGERIMQKYKNIRTADCVVGGFRYGTNSDQVVSLLLGLYDEENLLHHVGFTSALKDIDKKKLTLKLEKLIAKPGFTGKSPGSPSRWSTERSAEWQPLKPTLVVEIAFDHVTDARFRHGTKFLRWRPDKAPRQCRMEQILS